jgi:hypothetical protein
MRYSRAIDNALEPNMPAAINPAWIAYNDVQNEGGEGYNPHPKYVARAAAVVAPAAALSALTNKLVRNQRGNLIKASAMAEQLAKDEARLPKITDAYGRKLTEEAIAYARAALAAL